MGDWGGLPTTSGGTPWLRHEPPPPCHGRALRECNQQGSLARHWKGVCQVLVPCDLRGQYIREAIVVQDVWGRRLVGETRSALGTRRLGRAVQLKWLTSLESKAAPCTGSPVPALAQVSQELFPTVAPLLLQQPSSSSHCAFGRDRAHFPRGAGLNPEDSSHPFNEFIPSDVCPTRVESPCLLTREQEVASPGLEGYL
jgi:hypothetical protein